MIRSAAVAIELTKNHPGWPTLVPTILPLLIALYAMWARLPVLHRIFPEMLTSAAIWGAVLVLTIVPLAVSYKDSLPDPVRDARLEEAERAHEEQYARELAEQRQREAEKFAALNPDSSLADYLEYLLPGDNRFREAVEGVRRVKSRDSDAVTLLNEGRFDRLQEMWRFGTSVTPALCAAYGRALTGEALKVDKTISTNYIGVAFDLELQLPNIKWLISEHCNFNDVLDVLAKNIQALSDSPRLDKTAADFAALRQPR